VKRKTRAGVLLIGDLQVAFSPPPRLVERIRAYSRNFPRRIFTRLIDPPGSRFRRALGQTFCPPGSAESTLVIAPEKGDLVLCKDSDGFCPRDLRRLRRLGLKSVTICGLDSDACVLGVSFSLFDAGIRTVIEESLCWSSSGRRSRS
jgi:nicotinamidase-related amidase